ncbi:MAG: hypothetical protein JW959_12525 [Pirellulales bacterium]|nr:hypothetical protein [Pirellulales bacterium]
MNIQARLKNLPSPACGRGAGGEGGLEKCTVKTHSFQPISPHPNSLPKGEGTVFSISKHVLTAAVLFLGIVALSQNAVWAAEKIGGVIASVQPLPSMDNAYGESYGVSHGYVEYRVRLHNTSNEDRVVYLSYPSTSDRAITSGTVVSRTVPVAAGQEVEVSLFEPSMYSESNLLDVRVKGVRGERTIILSRLRDYRYDNNYPATLLTGRGVPQEFRDLVHPASAATTGTSYSSANVPLALLRSELPVGRWSANWLGYSCYDGILLTEKEVGEMPPPAQLAVRRYVECGGALWIHGRQVPPAFSQGGTPLGENAYAVGLGRAAATLAENDSDWKTTYERLKKEPMHVYRPEARPNNLNDMLIAEASVPVRGLFVLVLLFGVGIGPVNLWLLARHKRRIWLWWNVPAISLITCLLVFAYSLASEGIAGRGKIASMTILDERSHRAATFGYVSFYCPLTPSSGPRFGGDTEVKLLEFNPRMLSHRYYEPSGALRYVDWTSGQHLTSGWVAARAPAYFQFRKNEDRRERLTVERTADGALKIVNALGADIQRLFVSDSSGKVFEGRDIPAGAERTLEAFKPEKLVVGMYKDPQRVFCDMNWLPAFDSLRRSTPLPMLSPGRYVAFLDESPFVESPLAGVDPEHTAAIVYGIMKGDGDGR